MRCRASEIEGQCQNEAITGEFLCDYHLDQIEEGHRVRMVASPRCSATAKGMYDRPCRLPAAEGEDLCHVHLRASRDPALQVIQELIRKKQSAA